MGFSDGNGFFMPVAPSGYGGNNGFGFGGNDGGWWFLVILFAMFGWGGNGFANNGAAPYIIGQNNGNEVQRGFDQQAVMAGINSIKDSVCNGVPAIQQTITTGFANAEIGANARQMNDMNRDFAFQQNFNNAMAGQQMALADLKATTLAENCSVRQVLSDGVRDIIENNNQNTQRIVDLFYQNKIEQKDETIAALRQNALMAEIQRVNNGQTAQIELGQRNLATEIEQYVNPTARPAYIVQNPNCCPQNPCGCGY